VNILNSLFNQEKELFKIMLKRTRNYLDFKSEISKIIGVEKDHLNSPITPLLHTKWCLSNDGKYFNLKDYSDYTFAISSLGNKHETLFIGSKDGLYLIMGYPEDGSWNDNEVFIVDEKNKIEWYEVDDDEADEDE
jgi:hypothetical protein